GHASLDRPQGGNLAPQPRVARICLRMCSAVVDDRLGGKDGGGPPGPRQRFGGADPAEGNDLPASALEFVLKGRQAVLKQRRWDFEPGRSGAMRAYGFCSPAAAEGAAWPCGRITPQPMRMSGS